MDTPHTHTGTRKASPKLTGQKFDEAEAAADALARLDDNIAALQPARAEQEAADARPPRADRDEYVRLKGKRATKTITAAERERLSNLQGKRRAIITSLVSENPRAKCAAVT